jgi:hypothetical protein
MTKRESAIEYLNMGMSVIPVGKDKKPLISWLEFQNRFPTLDEINEWFVKFDDPNIGIVTGKISNLLIVDVDSLEALKDIEQYIPDSLDTPVVSTPRGGRHFYFRHIDGLPNRANVLPKIDLRTKGGFIVAPPSTNGNGKAWAWIRGLDTKIADAPSQLIFTLNKALTNTLNIREFNNQELRDVKDVKSCYFFSSEGTRDDDLYHAGHLLKNGNSTPEEMRKVLNILARNCNPPFPENEIEDKIKSILKRSERKDKNVSQAVRDWILLIESKFFVKDCYNELNIVNSADKLTVRVTINKLVAEGILEKDSTQRGTYWVKKTEEENLIDIYGADVSPVNIKFPLGVHELVKIMPKNIIMIAGEVNAGKSAYLLNLAVLNSHKMETVYFSSEMGDAELKERCSKFDGGIEVWRGVKFVDKSSDFHKAIRPNGLNIIDFLEIHDEFYKMGSLIKDIFDKLDKGIAIIAIQKNKGRDEGLGGERSKEKARLYLAIEPGKLKIVKAKNWISSEINPNGMAMEFKLAKGCKFKPQWEKWKRTD